MKLCVMSYHVCVGTMSLLLLLFDLSSAFLLDVDNSNNNRGPGTPAVAADEPFVEQDRDLGANVTWILNSFFESGYDKRVRPAYGGTPVRVKVSMFIVDISTVSEVAMDFTSDFYFRQIWRDDRLSFKEQEGIKELSVGAQVTEKIWVPDTFFANEKSAYFHTATQPNTFLRIKSNGEVLRSMRLTVTASCPMKLQYFPMDRQKCTIEVESYGYSMSDIIYEWLNDKAVGMEDSLKLPQFEILGHKQDSKVIVLSTGNYSRLICEVQLVRSMGYYLIQIYIPASLIVVISWVSFWLHRNATPARVQLGVLTVLTMTTLMSSTNSQLPKISYVKSIDVFLGTCFVMVFAALLEYAAVGYIGKRISMRKNRFQQLQKTADERRKRLLDPATVTATTSGPDSSPPTNVRSTSVSRYKSCEELRSQGGSGAAPPPLPPPPLLPPSYHLHHQSLHHQTHHSSHHPHHHHSSHHSSHHHRSDHSSHHQLKHQHSHPPPSSSSAVSHFATIRRHHAPGDRQPQQPGSSYCPDPASCPLTSSSGTTAPPTFPPPPHPAAITTASSSAYHQQQQQASYPHLYRQHSMSSGTQLIHRPQHAQHQQEVRLDVSGSKATTSTIPHSVSVRDLNPLSPGTGSGDNSGGNGGEGPSGRSRSATISQIRGTGAGPSATHYGSAMDRVPAPVPKNLNALFGVSPSDIDKYSRVVFPVCFICFNMMYWVIYLHISKILDSEFIEGED